MWVHRWLDKLGLAATLGLDVVMRQVLIGAGSYHLVDNNLDPLPVRFLWLLPTLFLSSAYVFMKVKFSLLFTGTLSEEVLDGPPYNILPLLLL